MDRPMIEEAAEQIYLIRKEKHELEKKEKELRTRLSQYLTERKTDHIQLDNGYELYIKSYIRDRTFDVNEAQAHLPLTVFMDLLTLDHSKFNQYLQKGEISDEGYNAMVIEEKWTQQLKVEPTAMREAPTTE